MENSLQYTDCVKLINLDNGDCIFKLGKLPNNIKFGASEFWLQKHTIEFEHHLHPAPRVQYVITLKGKLEFKVTNGTTFILQPGIVLIAQDTKGIGHSWDLIDGDIWQRIYIPIPDGQEDDFFIENF